MVVLYSIKIELEISTNKYILLRHDIKLMSKQIFNKVKLRIKYSFLIFFLNNKLIGFKMHNS